jgi:hypothetical protein
MVKGVATFGVLAWLGVASNASALVITGSGYSLPGATTGTCTASPSIPSTGSGATLTCSNIDLSAHTNVYIGIRNASNVNGLTMTGTAPAAGSAAVYRSSSTAASSITYTSTTTITSAIPAFGTDTVSNTLTLTRSAGTGSVVATGGTPANNSNGDIGHLFKITSGSTFTIEVDATSTDEHFSGQSCTGLYDPTHSTAGAGNCRSNVDIQFYWSDCGDGVVDSPEACDDGAANGTLASCCTTSCTFKTAGTVCTDDGNVCTDDVCNGVSSVCQHPNNSAPCNDGLFCNGADTCGGGTCSIHAGNPCPGHNVGPNCNDSCDEATDTCTAPDAGGTSCAGNGVGECSGADTCDGAGTCLDNDFAPGTPCTDLFPPSTGDCKDAQCDGGGTCDQAFANEPDATPCDDGFFCNGTETCSSGVCTNSTGDPCPGPDGDTNCSESCDEVNDNCLAPDPDGTTCRPDAGECDVEETCLAGVCPADGFEPSGTACGDPSNTDCTNPDTCDGSGNCQDNHESSGFPCGDPSDTDCTNPDTCDGAGSCQDNHESTSVVCRPATTGGDCDEVEFCDGAGNCPADAVKPANTVCRTDTGECDVEEVCDGVSHFCPPDNFEPSGTPCGDPSDTDCDNPDTCDGNNNCLDNNEPDGTLCTDDGETCTVDECNAGVCTHPAGNAGVECRAASALLLCDEAEECDGVNPTCPADAPKAAGEECRPAAGECDVAEDCDGISFNCPVDVFAGTSVTCADEGNPCTVDHCDGFGSCAHDPGNAGAICRPAASDCDVQETCDGVSATCPADGFESSGTPCGNQSDTECTNPDTCDGLGTCQSNNESDGTPCDDNDACTDGDECVNGTCVGPIDLCPELDHYKCYQGKDLKDPKFVKLGAVETDDQIILDEKVDVKKLKFVCSPVDKNGEGVNSPSQHLACYLIKAANLPSQPSVDVETQFQTSRFQLKKGKLICLPATKTVLP